MCLCMNDLCHVDISVTKSKQWPFPVNIEHLVFGYLLAEAQSYVKLIQTDGVANPVDIDTNGCAMQLPEWYDEVLFKRSVHARFCVCAQFIVYSEMFSLLD